VDLRHYFLYELVNMAIFRKGSWSTEENKNAKVLFVLITNSVSKWFSCTFPIAY